MRAPHRLTAVAAMAAMCALAAPRARALVTLEDGLDQIFVDGSFGVAYDTNVFANHASGGSATETATLEIEFARHAGWIGVNASMTWTATDFASYSSQNYLDPAMTVDLTKATGRTTGALSLSAQRTDRADVDVNTRDTSWNYNAALNVRYPVIERYSFAGSLAYSFIDYANHQLFTNLATYTVDTDLYYILSDARDLFGGYRYRYSQGSNNTHDIDNGLHGGISGRILSGINGSLSFGYDVRTPHGDATGQFHDYTASGSATWNFNRKMSFTGDISKDFGLTAADTTTDTTSANLAMQYTFSPKLGFSAGLGGGQTRFLGSGSEISVNGPNRTDWYVNGNVGVNYTLNQHLKANLAYTYYRNWSTLSFASFPRQNWNLNVTSHW